MLSLDVGRKKRYLTQLQGNGRENSPSPCSLDQTQELPLCLLQFASSVDFQQVFSLSGSTKQNSQNFRSLSCPFGVAWAKTVASHVAIEPLKMRLVQIETCYKIHIVFQRLMKISHLFFTLRCLNDNILDILGLIKIFLN